MKARKPAVAGAFYEGTPERLRVQVDQCFAANEQASTRQQFIGAVVPHAGFRYSGHVAAAVYGRLEFPRRLIILGPNHRGWGRPNSIDPHDAWLTPFGPAPVDRQLARELIEEGPFFEESTVAHVAEHAIEVQVPFLQTVAPESSFVPVSLADYSFDGCRRVGEAVAAVVARHREGGEVVSILASSDLNHYENQQVTLERDQKAIDCILALDPRRLYTTVDAERISMCGILPVTAMLVAALALGAQSATLIKHATSGDVGGGYDSVVGYAGIVVA
jgi:AmmeMemoRadiSam system protein B